MVLLSLTACGYTGGPSKVPQSIADLRTELVGKEWFGDELSLTFLSDGTIKSRIAEVKSGFLPESPKPCAIPSEFLSDPVWELSKFATTSEDSVRCTMKLAADGEQPSEFQLHWMTDESPLDVVHLTRGECSWHLMRSKWK